VLNPALATTFKNPGLAPGFFLPHPVLSEPVEFGGGRTNLHVPSLPHLEHCNVYGWLSKTSAALEHYAKDEKKAAAVGSGQFDSALRIVYFFIFEL
jgi:hypothetical protein